MNWIKNKYMYRMIINKKNLQCIQKLGNSDIIYMTCFYVKKEWNNRQSWYSVFTIQKLIIKSCHFTHWTSGGLVVNFTVCAFYISTGTFTLLLAVFVLESWLPCIDNHQKHLSGDNDSDDNRRKKKKSRKHK